MIDADDGLPPPLPLAPERRSSQWLRLIAFGLCLLAAWTFAHHVSLPKIQLCIAKVSTGYPCPGCGMTRSIVSLGHGDLLASLRFHPLGVVLVGATLAGWLGAAIGLVRGRDPFWAFLDRHGPWLMISFLVALFAVWTVRTWVVPEWAPDPIGKPTHPIVWAFDQAR